MVVVDLHANNDYAALLLMTCRLIFTAVAAAAAAASAATADAAPCNYHDEHNVTIVGQFVHLA